jgi:hypothetical protein
MKKILLAFLVLLILFAILVFFFIPANIIITESRDIQTTSGGFDSCLHKPGKWKQWWPDQSVTMQADSSFSYKGFTFRLSAPYNDGGTIRIGSGTFSLETRIQSISNGRDSITVNWGVSLPTGNNPFTRFSRYLDAGKLRKSMQVVFDSLCHFAGNNVNTYGFPIERTTFTEVMLIASRFKSTHYPSTELLYNTITQLRQYASSQGATEKYYPMMNTRQVDSTNWETMVAISIDKNIPVSREFFIKQMVQMKDRFLATDVIGGRTTIEKAHMAVEKYMADHSLSGPAIPFEILITDRSKESDSSKWKTRIFYPSM